MLLTDRDPASAQVDERGRVLSRPMVNPAVGDLLEGTTLPAEAKSKRRPLTENSFPIEDEEGELLATYGTRRMNRRAAPDSDDDLIARESFADDQRGEEMEQHLSEQGSRDSTALVAALTRALGTPSPQGQPPITADLARLSVFAEQALRLGISGAQAETIIREVAASPDGRMSDALRDAIAEGFRAAGQSPAAASVNLERLERSAALIPIRIEVTGTMGQQINRTTE
jgi:hypothetical protein